MKRFGPVLCLLAALWLSACSTVVQTLSGGPHPLERIDRFGLVFLGRDGADATSMTRPGVPGEAALWAQGVGAGLLWLPGWVVGGPLWVPGVFASGHAECRAAVNADPDAARAFRSRLEQWPAIARLNEVLADGLTDRSPARSAIVPRSSPPTAQDAVLATAAARGIGALFVFRVTAIELQTQSAQPACPSHLVVVGKIRVLRSNDGSLLDLQLAQGPRCARRTGTPLAILIHDDQRLREEMDAALECAVSELILWSDSGWRP